MKRDVILIGVTACALVAAAGTASAGVWHRETDWVPGSVPGSSLGNGDGTTPWSYEWTTGGSLDDATPWFVQETQLLVWDPEWWATGRAAWARADNTNPPVFQDRFTHVVGRASDEFIPLVRFTNPHDVEADVVVEGVLEVQWSGMDFLGDETDVDVVIALDDASEGEVTPLFTTTVSKPNPGLSIGDSVDIDVLLTGILMDVDDSLIVTHRGREVFDTGRWIPMLDDLTLTLEPIPTPGTLALLGFSGAALRRRRR